MNGVGDADFTADPSSIPVAGGALPRHGVTSFLPTIVTSPRGTVERALAALAGPSEGATPLGLHVEGPFISPQRLGVHDPALRRDPDLGEIRDWLAGGARMITLAPELPGALEAIETIAAQAGSPPSATPMPTPRRRRGPSRPARATRPTSSTRCRRSITVRRGRSARCSPTSA